MPGEHAAAVRRHNPGGPVSVEHGLDDLGACGDLRARPPCGRDEGRRQGARIHVRLVRGVHAADAGGREPGLQLATLPRGQPLGRQPERALEVVQAPQLGRLVGIERSEQGAAALVRNAEPARLLELRGERRPTFGRGEVEREQPLLAKASLCDRGEHAGGRERRAAAGLVAFEQADSQAAPRSPPGAGEADHAPAGDGDVEALGRARHWLPPPCAGITRIRS